MALPGAGPGTVRHRRQGRRGVDGGGAGLRDGRSRGGRPARVVDGGGAAQDHRAGRAEDRRADSQAAQTADAGVPCSHGRRRVPTDGSSHRPLRLGPVAGPVNDSGPVVKKAYARLSRTSPAGYPSSGASCTRASSAIGDVDGVTLKRGRA